jgi:hypothetical protein
MQRQDCLQLRSLCGSIGIELGANLVERIGDRTRAITDLDALLEHLVTRLIELTHDCFLQPLRGVVKPSLCLLPDSLEVRT